MMPLSTEDRPLHGSTEQKRTLEHHFARNLDTLAYPLLANIYFEEGDLTRARQVCKIGLTHHPHHAPGLFLMALVNLRESQLEPAEDLLTRTLSQDPYHVEAAELLVAVKERLKRSPAILEQAYKTLLHANPLSRDADLRLKRMQAERELVRQVKRDVQLRDGSAEPGQEPNDERQVATEDPHSPDQEGAPAELADGAEPRTDKRHRTSDEAAPAQTKHDPAGTTEEKQTEIEADLTWESNIKRVAASLATGSEGEAEAEETVEVMPEGPVAEAGAPPQEQINDVDEASDQDLDGPEATTEVEAVPGRFVSPQADEDPEHDEGEVQPIGKVAGAGPKKDATPSVEDEPTSGSALESDQAQDTDEPAEGDTGLGKVPEKITDLDIDALWQRSGQTLGPDEAEAANTTDKVPAGGDEEITTVPKSEHVTLSDALPPDAEELVEASPPSGPAEALDTGTDTGAGQVIDDAPTPLPEPDESEVPAADATTGKQDSSSAPWIDPKLATFTLATIYKVQGLYKQALQVLDMLEAKGGDPERIEDERRSITRSMTSGSKPE